MSTAPLLPLQAITQRIVVLREQQVLIDSDLAALYGVVTRRLIEQVRRNPGRLPEDFIFVLSPEEFAKRPIGFINPEDKGKKTSGPRGKT